MALYRKRKKPAMLSVGLHCGVYFLYPLLSYLYLLSPCLWETAQHRLKHAQHRLKHRLKDPLIPKQPTNEGPGLQSFLKVKVTLTLRAEISKLFIYLFTNYKTIYIYTCLLIIKLYIYIYIYIKKNL